MINLDQVRTLEWKVKQAVQLVGHLRRENDALRGRLSDTEVRIQELESLLEAVKASQSEMESGIRSALEDLDFLEDTGTSPPVQAEVQVDQLSYPPQTETVAVPVVPSPEPEQVIAALEVNAEASFEEEFAALAAAEAAALDENETAQEPIIEDSVPESVELEADPVTPPEETREPEQPGLGIF